jgi:EmrB/QacA subfamily drug resistance transporter
VLLAGAFMVVLDFFIVNVTLPSIAAELGASASALEWIVAGYGLTFAAFLVTAGRLGDDVGRRRLYAIGLALFVLTSAACGLAPSPTTLVLARIGQGVAAAIVMPQVLSIIGVTYRGEDYVRALSIYGVVLGLAAVGGQVIGGALVEGDVAGLGWRWCFLINVPVGIGALIMTPRLVPESRADERRRPDLVGSALIATGLVAILLPLIEGRQQGWPTWTWLSFAAAVAILGAFVHHQHRLGTRGGAPLLDLALFADRGFSAGLATQLCLAATQAAFFVYLALYLQLGRGLGALESGLVFAIVAVAYVVVSGPATKYTAAHGRTIIGAGAVALGCGLALLAVAVGARGVDGPVLALVPGLLFAGAGVGMCFTPLTATVLATVAPQRAGAASGVMSTTQQVGYALGVAVTGLLFFGTGPDVGHAFALSLLQLTLMTIAVGMASRSLPGANAPTRPRPRLRVERAAGATAGARPGTR